MNRASFAFGLALASLALGTHAATPQAFELFNDCSGMDLSVDAVGRPEDVSLNLPATIFHNEAEATLLAAELFQPGHTSRLHARLLSVGDSTSLALQFKKRLVDVRASILSGVATTWESVRVHAIDDPDALRASVSRQIEDFLGAYRAVNADACAAR